VATIVLADDSADLRAVYGACLRARGHEVHEAADGIEAVELVRRIAPELLLLDVWMPNLNGFEVLDALRSEPAAGRLKVAMLSILGDGDSQLEAFGGGAVEYLVKGLALRDVLARVEGLLAAGAPAPTCPTPS
jgi:DNA-binding response OmpR family regulator